MRKLNLILSYSAILSVFVLFNTWLYNLFAKIAWILLLIIVFSRPLADIFRHYKLWDILRKIVSIRQWLWIVCWIFALAHWIWYFMDISMPVTTLFTNPKLRNIKNLVWSWIRAMIFMLLPLITSHVFWMRKLWKNRKKIQRLTYPTFIITAFHVGLARWEILKFSIIILIYIVVYILAYKMKKCHNQKNQLH